MVNHNFPFSIGVVVGIIGVICCLAAIPWRYEQTAMGLVRLHSFSGEAQLLTVNLDQTPRWEIVQSGGSLISAPGR